MNIVPSGSSATEARHAALWDDPHDLTLMRADDLALIYDVARDMDLPALPLYADLYADPTQRQAFIASGWFGDTLVDTGWHRGDAMIFFAHLGREAIHASRDRQFSKAHWQTVCSTCRDVSRSIDPEGRPRRFPGCSDPSCGHSKPRLYPPQKLGDKQYIKITHSQRSAFVTVDVDVPGSPGGSINDIDPEVLGYLNALTKAGCAPNLVGVNPVSGKAQVIWFIDPVYNDGDETKPNRPTKFLQSLHRDLNTLLGGDTSFSHGFMRNPFYGGHEPEAYRWNHFHGSVYSMKQIRVEVTRLLEVKIPEFLNAPTPPKTGRELIDEVKARRLAAESHSQLAKELGYLPVEELEAIDPNYVQGVRIKYNDGVVARNVTAFEHALKVATRMRKRGERLTDSAIIHAFIHAYGVALVEAKDGRPSELPGEKELIKTAQRIRGYVTSNARHNNTGSPTTTGKTATSHERKVLSTFGKRGGTTTAKRRVENPDRPDAKKLREGWAKANQRRHSATRANKADVLAFVVRQESEAGSRPTRREVMEEFSISESTAKRYLRAVRDLL